MRYRLSLVSLMVSLLLGTSLMSVTTAAAAPPAQTVPSQCEWPVTGNIVSDGTFDGDGSEWFVSADRQAISQETHPCSYVYQQRGSAAPLHKQFSHNASESVTIGVWVRHTFGSTSGPIQFSFGHPDNVTYDHPNFWQTEDVYFSHGPDGGWVSGSWIYHASCYDYEVPIRTSFVTVSNYSLPYTGLSIVFNDHICSDIAAVPTATPTAVPTATPTPIPTLTPFPAPTKPPPLLLTAVPTIPQSVRDLPVLPPPLEVSAPPVDMADMPLPDIGMDEGIFIIQIIRTTTQGLAESDAWTMIRYLAYSFLSVGLLTKLIF